MLQEYIDYIGHAAYGLTLLAFLFRTVVWLRLFAILGSVAAIAYSYYVSSFPLWVPIIWHGLYLIVNLVQLLVSRWQSRSVRLNPIEDYLAQTALESFSSAEVKRFVSYAEEHQVGPQQEIIQEGESLDMLFFVLGGAANVIQGGQVVAQLSAGYFIGEMSLLTKSEARATVVSAQPMHVLTWHHSAIDEWVKGDASRLAMLQTALGNQIVEVLMVRSLPEAQENQV